MRIGTHIHASGSIDDVLADAAAACGLDSVWTNQLPGGWDPLTVLTRMTDGPAELGTAVVPTYPRHPVALATEAVTVQALTGGRLTLGIGPSHELAITGWFGLPYTAPLRHTREYLDVLRPLMAGEHVTHRGEFFTVDTKLEVSVTPPPVLVGALGPKMLAVARDHADGTVAIWTRPAMVADYLVPRLAGARVAVMPMVVVTDDPDGARAQVAATYGASGEMPAYRAMLDRGGLTGPAEALVTGDEETVVRELRRYRDAGATDLIAMPVGTRAERARTLAVLDQV